VEEKKGGKESSIKLTKDEAAVLQKFMNKTGDGQKIEID